MSVSVVRALDTFEQKFDDLKQSVPFGKDLEHGYLVEYVRRNENRTLQIAFGASKWTAAAPGGDNEVILLSSVNAACEAVMQIQQSVDTAQDLAKQRGEQITITLHNAPRDEWRVNVGNYLCVLKQPNLTPGYAKLKMLTHLATSEWAADNYQSTTMTSKNEQK